MKYDMASKLEIAFDFYYIFIGGGVFLCHF